jgi:hypothetical protein
MLPGAARQDLPQPLLHSAEHNSIVPECMRPERPSLGIRFAGRLRSRVLLIGFVGLAAGIGWHEQPKGRRSALVAYAVGTATARLVLRA